MEKKECSLKSFGTALEARYVVELGRQLEVFPDGQALEERRAIGHGQILDEWTEPAHHIIDDKPVLATVLW